MTREIFERLWRGAAMGFLVWCCIALTRGTLNVLTDFIGGDGASLVFFVIFGLLVSTATLLEPPVDPHE